MGTEVADDVVSGNVRRLAKAPSNVSNRRRHEITQPMKMAQRRQSQSKTPSVPDLMKQVAELEEEKRKQEAAKKQDANQSEKNMKAAKKKIAKEIRSAQQTLRKNEQDVGRLMRQVDRLVQLSDLERVKNSRQLQKIDQDAQKLQVKRKTLSEALQEKTAALGEARGRLAHMEFYASLLELGVDTSMDLNAKGCIRKDGGAQASQGLVTTIAPNENARVGNGLKNLESTFANPDPVVQGGADATIAHFESLNVACAEAVSAADATIAHLESLNAAWSEAKSTNDGSCSVPDLEDASGDMDRPSPVVNSQSNRSEHVAMSFSKNCARFASSVNSGQSAFENSNCAPSVVHQTSLGTQACLAYAAPPMEVPPGSVEQIPKLSLTVPTADGLRAPDEKAKPKDEIAPPLACRLQDAAYNRSSDAESNSMFIRPSAPLSKPDELLVQNNALRARSVVGTIESRCVPPNAAAPDMIRCVRSGWVAPYRVTSSKSSVVTSSPTWASGDVRLKCSATQGTRLPSSSRIRSEPVATSLATALHNGYS